jgi:hypothetical protein
MPEGKLLADIGPEINQNPQEHQSSRLREAGVPVLCGDKVSLTCGVHNSRTRRVQQIDSDVV